MKKTFWLMVAVLFIGSNPVSAQAWGWLCEDGCPAESCDGLPYTCKAAGHGDMCVAKGFDYGTCGGHSISGGYCFKCSGGCEDVGVEGSCGAKTCTADTGTYCCRDPLGIDSLDEYRCMERGFDCGCCGGPVGGSCIRRLIGSITNKGGTAETHLVEFYIAKDTGCEPEPPGSDFTEITTSCVEFNEGELSLTVEGGKSKTVKCTSLDKLPPEDTGPHCVKFKWGDNVVLAEYGSPAGLTCDSCESCTEAIKNAKEGDTILLMDDISDYPGICITWENDGVTFDCGGHFIDGRGSDSGIYMIGGTGNTIQDCTIKEFWKGVFLSDTSNNNVLKDNTVNENEGDGIIISTSENNVLTGNTVNKNKQCGIVISSSNNNVLTKNTVNENEVYGVWIFFSSNGNKLTDNTVNENNKSGIYISSSSNANELTDNTVNENEGEGIVIHGSSGDAVTHNIVKKNHCDGIKLESSSHDIRLYENTVCSIVGTDIYVIEQSTTTSDSDENTCDYAGGYHDASVSYGCVKRCTPEPGGDFKLAVVPVGWEESEAGVFNSKANDVITQFRDKTPFRICTAKVAPVILQPSDCGPEKCAKDLNDCIEKAYECLSDKGVIYDKFLAISSHNDHDSTGKCGGIPSIGAAVKRDWEISDLLVPTHELGHTLGFAHVNGGGVNCDACPSYPNCPDCSKSEGGVIPPEDEDIRKDFIMSYYTPISCFGPAAYGHLKDFALKPHLDGCPDDPYTSYRQDECNYYS
ncbi:MAG: NosD domain-containing protein [Candidatus Altiarchaeota archaeon]|nr:NosD domain-containing protein [Candidatus Altiarchaeota archaeon]